MQSDSSTISYSSDPEIETWTNKVDPTVKLHAHSSFKPNLEPNTDGKYNNLPVINFDGATGNYDRFSAKKNGSTNWSALSEDGSVSGTYSGVSFFIVIQQDTLLRTTWPFGLNWEGISPGKMAISSWIRQAESMHLTSRLEYRSFYRLIIQTKNQPVNLPGWQPQNVSIKCSNQRSRTI